MQNQSGTRLAHGADRMSATIGLRGVSRTAVRGLQFGSNTERLLYPRSLYYWCGVYDTFSALNDSGWGWP
jgi:hypothetical protein